MAIVEPFLLPGGKGLMVGTQIAGNAADCCCACAFRVEWHMDWSLIGGTINPNLTLYIETDYPNLPADYTVGGDSGGGGNGDNAIDELANYTEHVRFKIWRNNFSTDEEASPDQEPDTQSFKVTNTGTGPICVVFDGDQQQISAGNDYVWTADFAENPTRGDMSSDDSYATIATIRCGPCAGD